MAATELSTSGEKERKTEEEVREEDGANDEAGEGDTTLGEAVAPNIKPETPPGGGPRIAQSVSMRLPLGMLGALQATNGRAVTGGKGAVTPPSCDVWLLGFDLLASVGGLPSTVDPGSSSMTIE